MVKDSEEINESTYAAHAQGDPSSSGESEGGRDIDLICSEEDDIIYSDTSDAEEVIAKVCPPAPRKPSNFEFLTQEQRAERESKKRLNFEPTEGKPQDTLPSRYYSSKSSSSSNKRVKRS